ncbi:Dyp-type peroxidase [Ornithinimicrobium sp. Y1847]|uniref:Dyp-type peroxidase n=1 Tax=Ornithinimicrobium sp. Y1847 TaxID=3405419 RepID=UPI003B673776
MARRGVTRTTRDLLGFVDGTENPTVPAVVEHTVFVGADDIYAGASYVVIQKYLHDLTAWESLPTEEQERVIGRRKLSDIQLSDEALPSNSHVALNTIQDENGVEHQILRDNLPFGSVSSGELGTFFIGYAADPRTTELMLERMFVGHPPGNYDRILDFSTATTGCLFFVLPAAFLDDPTPFLTAARAAS